jgi:hypothetical protein
VQSRLDLVAIFLSNKLFADKAGFILV